MDAEALEIVREDVQNESLKRLMSMAENALHTWFSDYRRRPGGGRVRKSPMMKGEEWGGYLAILQVIYRLHWRLLRKQGVMDRGFLSLDLPESDLHAMVLENLARSGRLFAVGRGNNPGDHRGRIAGSEIHWEPLAHGGSSQNVEDPPALKAWGTQGPPVLSPRLKNAFRGV